ncbi:uncharacterized protein K452DRAFT_309158 [Aplosporella prunicola CBS 121167]|uniref:DUF1754-domain-containing protein n=1 Tax=Aplosporella prunicola CBS 121167 TaxID=1176127 RepID=A0A6A6BB05_9PEZI|nr:uncharacterized protein K452DRAFT_309158 [Aplosporella prunicola CBS 121167]KAF2141389.1 hypothetical protein K452DRAFT_309158 [Aplosporella prunicola CBS 121167]
MAVEEYKLPTPGALKLKGGGGAVEKKRKAKKKAEVPKRDEPAEGKKDAATTSKRVYDVSGGKAFEEGMTAAMAGAGEGKKKPAKDKQSEDFESRAFVAYSERGRMEAEIRFAEHRRKHLGRHMEREGRGRTHAEKVVGLNKALSKRSDHYDI